MGLRRKLRKNRAWRRLTDFAAHGALNIVLLPYEYLILPSVRLFQRWRKSTRIQYLVRGVPALILAIGVGYLAAATSLTSNAERAVPYELAADRAFLDKRYDTARILYDRLIELRVGSYQNLLGLAHALDELGDSARFTVIMDELAPLERPIYAPAHLQQAQRLLSHEKATAQSLQFAEIHLKHALQLEPKNEQTHRILGQFYFATGSLDGAIEHLSSISRPGPDLCLTLAKAHALKGETPAAREHGLQAQKKFREQLELKPLDLGRRLSLVDSTMFLEQFPEAIKMLKQGLELFEGNEDATLALRQTAAKTYIACYDLRERQGNADPVEQFKLLAAGLNANPNEILLFQRLMDILERRDQAAGEATRFLTFMLARGEATALVHLLLGTDATERGKIDTALKHLQQAQKTDPSMMFAANNLAWVLAHSDPPQLQRGLDLINGVVEIAPNVGPYRDTRGQILAKLGRWDEALLDLQFALPKMPNNLQLHETLAQAYSELGMSDLASEHRCIATEIGGSTAAPAENSN